MKPLYKMSREEILKVLYNEEKELNKDLMVIATGGLGRIITENTDLIDLYDPELTFKGLRIIYEKQK